VATRQDVFDQWWASLTEVAPDQMPTPDPSALVPPLGADPARRRDESTGRWSSLRDRTWDEW
jgi:hypothetical protein